MLSNRCAFYFVVVLAILTLGACTAPTTLTPPDISPSDTPAPEQPAPTVTAVPTNTPLPTPPPRCRQTILEPTEPIHAVHMTGNWGPNYEPDNTLPAGYFEYLRGLNANWVGIQVGLHYDDSMDSTVERKYSGVAVPTWSDDFLRTMIRTFHQNDICVYLALNLEFLEPEQAERPAWNLGHPNLAQGESRILPEFWPWAIDHPDHQRFVAEFWDSYTEQAVHFGQLAEEEGAALYALGTEEENLFRTRPSDEWPNDFGNELRAMVAAVREVYSGPLTYDMVYAVLTHPEWFGSGIGSEHLWEDMDLDVIGLSGYFSLVDSPPTRLLSVQELEQSWETIFQEYLIPLQAANPDRPIYFTEFDYVDSIGSPYDSAMGGDACRLFSDMDSNGLDDGEETQANIYQALFNVMDRHPGVLNGTFLWEMQMADAKQVWYIAEMRGFSMRDKLAEDVVRAYYGGEPRATPVDLYLPIPTPFAVEESQVIYDDGLAEGWDLETWEAEVDTAAESVVHDGQVALGITPGPWGNISFFNPLDLSEYGYLEFYIHGGQQGGQPLMISIWDIGNNRRVEQSLLCRVISSTYALPPDEWFLVRFPLQHLDLANRRVSINIQSDSDQPAPQFFLDDIRLVKEGD